MNSIRRIREKNSSNIDDENLLVMFRMLLSLIILGSLRWRFGCEWRVESGEWRVESGSQITDYLLLFIYYYFFIIFLHRAQKTNLFKIALNNIE